MENTLSKSQKLVNYIHNPSDYEWIGDLLYLDGPFSTLMLLKENRDFYFFDWCEQNNTHHRWMRYKVEPNFLLQYFDKKINRKNLVFKSYNEHLLFFDVSGTYDNLVYENIQIVNINFIPCEYFPTEESFFDSDLCPDEVQIRTFIQEYFIINKTFDK